MADLKDIIRDQIEANNASMLWGEAYLKGQEKKDNREKLIQNRITLNRINYAAGVNPGAAVFGQSQVGKSYMVDCLLTSETSPLNVYDAQGNATGFLKSINPTGGGREATALISRFTTKKVWDNPAFPIKCVLLTPIDVVCVIVDAYYNDLKDFQKRSDEDVRAEIERLRQRYGSQAKQQKIIGEDEIYELKEYFESDLMERGEIFRNSLSTCKYFEQLAEIISRVGVNQWSDVFGFLWNHSPIITDLFEKLIRLLQKFDFARTVYTKTDPVLRSGGTILHVDRIYEMFGVDTVTEGDKTITITKATEPTLEVLTDKGVLVRDVSKGEFCALAMEIDFTIDDPTKYYGGEDSPLVKEKPFLKNLDILDFPGARSREKIVESELTTDTACRIILRGKVAYLFNKYSSQFLISNLFFCHHDTQCEVSTLGELLQGWVHKTIGETAEERGRFIAQSKVSPLFMIGTKFNTDMVRTPDDSNVNSREELKKRMAERWTKRFGNLKDIVRPSATNDWFNNWTDQQTYFDNIYLLRSFAFSCLGGLYEGYQEKKSHEDGHVTWEICYNDDGTMRGETNVRSDYESFFEDLYETFKEDDFVKKHFPKTQVPTAKGPNKQVSWAEATEVGKDGSEWIIKNLTVSSNHMVNARRHQFERLYRKTFESLLEAMSSQYHDPSKDMILKETMEDAGRIRLLLDGLFSTDKYFFTELLDRILIREDELHDMILEIIRNNAVITDTDMQPLFAIRNRAGIDPMETEEENRRRLRVTYSIETDQALDSFLERMGYTVDDIINPPKVRNLARIIVDAVEQYWLQQYLDVSTFQDFVDRGMMQEYLEKLIEKIRVLYTARLRISDLMTRRIQVYVVDQTHIDEMAEMIADICAEMINNFVNTMGTAYFNDSVWGKVRKTIERNNFDNINLDFILTDIDDTDQEKIRSNMGVVFEVFDNVDKILNANPVDFEKLKYFSNYDAFSRWTNMMKIAFLVTCDIPTYNIAANNELRRVLTQFIFLKPTKDHLMKEEYYDRYHLNSFKAEDSAATPAQAEA